jgi:hypothetical protein
MAYAPTAITEFATVNLHYALAELTSIGDRESVLRAIDHIRQAQACLEIVAVEYETPPDTAGAEAA